MKNKNETRARDLLFGILLGLVCFSLLFSVAAILFSEAKNPKLALDITLILSFISAAAYWLLEYCVFYKNCSSAFSLGYFGIIVLGSAITFFVTSVFPLQFIFDYSASLNAAYLKSACVRFSLFNSVALVLRLGTETYRYIKDIFGDKNEQ